MIQQEKPSKIRTETINKLRLALLITGLVLFFDGAILVLNNKIHFGTLLPLGIGAVFCIYGVYFNAVHTFLRSRPQLRRLWAIGWGIFMVWSLSLIIFFIYHLERKTLGFSPRI